MSPIKGMKIYEIKLQMKFILIACLFAYACSLAISATSLSWTVAYNAGTTSNATCALTGSFLATYAGMGSTADYMGLWVASTSAVTTTSTSDNLVFYAWTVTSTAADALSTTITTAPTGTLYGSSGSAWTASSSSLTTNGSSLTAGTTGIYTTAFTTYFPFTAINMTSSNFTKSSLSWNYWAYISETAAFTQSSSTWTSTATGSTSISLSACTTGMSAIKSGSIASSILSSIFALSFF